MAVTWSTFGHIWHKKNTTADALFVVILTLDTGWLKSCSELELCISNYVAVFFVPHVKN